MRQLTKQRWKRRLTSLQGTVGCILCMVLDSGLASQAAWHIFNDMDPAYLEALAADGTEESPSDMTVSACTSGTSAPMDWDFLEEYRDSWDSSPSGNEGNGDHGSTTTALTSTLPEQRATMKQKDMSSDSDDSEQSCLRQRIIISL